MKTPLGVCHSSTERARTPRRGNRALEHTHQRLDDVSEARRMWRAASSAMIWHPMEFPTSAVRLRPSFLIQQARASERPGTPGTWAGFLLLPKPGRSGA